MATQLIFSASEEQDFSNVCNYIDQLAEDLGTGPMLVDTRALRGLIKGCRQDFPYKNGYQGASAFKQVAYFVCFFISERPIQNTFSKDVVGRLAEIDNHQNAIAAFSIARSALHMSTIERADMECTVESEVALSAHSYADIIDALAHVTPSTSFKLVTVLLEQLVYKTNLHCQYSVM